MLQFWFRRDLVQLKKKCCWPLVTLRKHTCWSICNKTHASENTNTPSVTSYAEITHAGGSLEIIYGASYGVKPNVARYYNTSHAWLEQPSPHMLLNPLKPHLPLELQNSHSSGPYTMDLLILSMSLSVSTVIIIFLLHSNSNPDGSTKKTNARDSKHHLCFWFLQISNTDRPVKKIVPF